MPSLTTGELVSILLDKNARSLLDTNPSKLIEAAGKFIQKNKDLPSGLTISQIVEAVEDIASREFGCKRSSKWPKVRQAYLKAHQECAACGGKTSLDVHHVLPYHLRPDLELESSNLLTLCEKSERFGWACHRVFGHLGNWKMYNQNMVNFCKLVRGEVDAYTNS